MRKIVFCVALLSLFTGIVLDVNGQGFAPNQPRYRVVSIDKAAKTITVNEQVCSMQERGAGMSLVCDDGDKMHTLKITAATTFKQINTKGKNVPANFSKLEEGQTIQCKFDTPSMNVKSILMDKVDLVGGNTP